MKKDEKIKIKYSISVRKESVYLIVSNKTGTMTVSAVSFTRDQAIVTISGTGTIDVEVRGNEYEVDTNGSGTDEPDVYGEAANVNLVETRLGKTYNVINPLILDDTEAIRIAEDFVVEYGTPAFNVDIEDNFINALIDANDPVMFISEDLFESTIYELKGLSYNFLSETKKIASFELLDTGRKFTDEGAITYDRDFYDITITPVIYGIGHFYDSIYRIGATESEIGTSQYSTNIGFS